MATKMEKQKLKESKELTKLKNEKKEYAGYMLVMMSLLSIIRCIDEFASTIGSSIQSWLVNEFIAVPNGLPYQEALSQWSLLSTVLMIFTILAVFYLALSDRFGRKKILTISVFGMAAGMAICYSAHSVALYMAGGALITFFVATDVHQIYVMEIAPDKKRATYLQITAVFGQVGAFLVAASRIFFTEGEVLNWRMLYLVPAIVGLVTGVVLIFTARETNAFLKQRIAFLEKPVEQRAAEAAEAKKNKAANEDKTGMGAAFSYMFRHKQPRATLLAAIPQLASIMAFTGYTESIMTTNGLTTTDVNFALLMMPLAAAVMAVLTGVLSDKAGRRPTAIVTSVIALASLIGFVVLTKNGASPLVIGIVNGFANGAMFRYGDTLGLQRLESVPTNIRAASASAFGLIAVVVALGSGIVLGILVAQFELSMLCLVWGSVAIGLSALMNFTMVKETKDIDLSEI